MNQERDDRVAQGREAFRERQWQKAFDLLLAADAMHPLGPEELEILAWAARWTGRYPEWARATQRAEELYVELGKRRDAGRIAVYLAHHYFEAGNDAVSQGYAARASRLLEQEPECAEHGLEAWFSSWRALTRGDIRAGRESAERAVAIGRKLSDRNVEALGTLWLGRALIADRRCEEGVRLQDEACALVVSGHLEPFAAGMVYCSMIHGCMNRADWRRAMEWTQVLGDWINRESVAFFPGLCRLHQAEVQRIRGELSEAEADASSVLQELVVANPRMTGWAYGELAEIRLRRGDLRGADDACGHALELGVEPQPVLARLRLAEGDAASALRMIQRAVESVTLLWRERRVTMLPTLATCAIANGDFELARRAAEELACLAEELATPAPIADAACSKGEVLLAEGKVEQAMQALRRGRALFLEIDAPYESARAQTLLGAALENQGDLGSAVIELKAALAIFQRLGAERDVALVNGKLMQLPKGLEAGTRRLVRTFMFTDMAESTKLLEAVGDEAWQRLRRWHDRTLRGLFESFEGAEVDHAGDGFFVAFASSEQALKCAIAIQRRLAEHRVELPRFSGRLSAWVTSGYPQAARGAPQTQPSAQPCG
jgi:tetratricopeptide (TPR) repeat protein